MKKFAKILSSVLAASMVVSCFAMNAFAASKAHTATVTVDKTTGLKAGDTLTVELKIDSTLNICTAGYALNYDKTAFEVDTTITTDEIEAYIDADWYYDEITGSRKAWFKALGSPTYNATEDSIKWSWASKSGVASDTSDYTIGKFYLKVKDSAPDGTYNIGLAEGVSNSYTGDIGENTKAELTSTPVAITVGSGSTAPEPPATKTNYFAAKVNVNEMPTLAKTLVYTFKNSDGAIGTKDVALGVILEDTTEINTAVEVTDIPEGKTVTLESVTWKPWD